mmetsp:Transcript_58476/g.136660  ORF Transcript_58476/g.136660 Transcript_58476/m.136660 type:complete len:239 (-) Transcript_58476:86-802(-)
MAFTRRSRAPIALCLFVAALAGLTVYKATVTTTFVGLRGSLRNADVVVRAEAEGAPAPAPAPAPQSTELVKIDEANVKATAGVIAGLAGLLVGGLWIGVALFAASSYLVRKDDDLGNGIRGASTNFLEALNFTSSMDGKYKVTDKLGKTVSSAVEKNVKSADTKETINTAVGTVQGSIKDLDKEVGIKATLGSLVLTANDFSAQAVEKLLDFNEKNKVTDKLSEQVKGLASKAAAKKE